MSAIITSCRDAVAEEIPTTAARLAKNAAEHGWRSRVTYAQADYKDKVVTSVAVRLRQEPLAAYALWVDGKFDMAYVWSLFSSPRKIGSRDLAAFVRAVAQ